MMERVLQVTISIKSDPSRMEAIRHKQSLLVFALIVIQIYFLTSCNTKSYYSNNQVEKTGYLGFYLGMDYSKVRNAIDSMISTGELHYFETTDILGNKQKNLYSDFPEISPFLFAKVNLRGASIIDERLTSIQLTLGTRLKTGDQRLSYNCDLNDLERLFEQFTEKYGKPTLIGEGEKYDWLSERISNLYFTGPKGRWAMDKIYCWEKGGYVIYFDFGYPESPAKSGDPELPVSTSAPVIYYDFSQDYIDELLEEAGKIK